MASGAPTGSEIRAAKRNAVGGGRKRCRKGKNCSAACIQAGMVCLVEMPEPSQVATKKVRDFLQKGEVKSKGRIQRETGPLTGDALIAKVKEMGEGAPKEDLIKATGYLSENGKLNFTGFYEALLKAKGLWDEPEPEVKPVKNKVKDEDLEKAKRYETEAKKVKLDRDEKKALQDYTDGKIDPDDPKKFNYFRINEALREGEDEWSLDDTNSKMAEQIRSIDYALGKLPKNSNREIFYRGMTFSSDDEAFNEFTDLRPGDKFKDLGYSSFSASKGMAKRFYGSYGGGEEGNNKVLFVSKNSELTPINAFSKHPEEIEAVLPRKRSSTVSWVKEGEDPKGGKVLIIGLDYD